MPDALPFIRFARRRSPAAAGLLAATVVLAALGAESCTHKSLEYPFLVSGTVSDASGQPLDGVRVTLEIQGMVYDGTTPVHRTDTYSDDRGRFAFDYVTRDPTQLYSLWFDKEGYESSSIEKASLAKSVHAVTLARRAP
jgi:hypothetical protein